MRDARRQLASTNGPVPTGRAMMVVGIGLDHFACHRTEEARIRQQLVVARVRLIESDLERVAAPRARAWHLAVVVEAPGLGRLVA
jgi:hypothetical protein